MSNKDGRFKPPKTDRLIHKKYTKQMAVYTKTM
jgi:hypothetical protein